MSLMVMVKSTLIVIIMKVSFRKAGHTDMVLTDLKKITA